MTISVYPVDDQQLARDDSRDGSGTGHGLAAMRDRVHKHGGTMKAGPHKEGRFGIHVLPPAGGPA